MELLAFGVYLCGDEYPTAIFPFHDKSGKESALLHARAWPINPPRWMDKEIKEIDLKKSLDRSDMDSSNRVR
jgi:hypothetical protein